MLPGSISIGVQGCAVSVSAGRTLRLSTFETFSVLRYPLAPDPKKFPNFYGTMIGNGKGTGV